MPGGILNLISQGNQNIYLNGNPPKTFFKAKYAKYTNFGLQKFRIDFEGSRTLRLSEDSTFKFKIPRYADLLMDSYIVVDMPYIWSPLYPPQDIDGVWAPYEFKWIENLGCEMIREITITCGGQLLQKYSGSYIKNMADREFNSEKKKIFDEMTGHTTELNDPANHGSRVNVYPNAYFTENTSGAHPSINNRKLYIPLNSWFSMDSKTAFPLIALQYNELFINVTFRPIYELFMIRDVQDSSNNFPYVQPNFNKTYMQMYHFLQTPPSIALNENDYSDQRGEWAANVHMIATYGFLSDEESRVFALNEQRYLIKEIHEYKYYDVTGSKKIKIDSLGMVSNWMFYLQRSDANLRNQWSNYTNWPYNYLPYDVHPALTNGDWKYKTFVGKNDFENAFESGFGPGINPNGTATSWYVTGVYSNENKKEILESLGILLDGNYRENLFDKGVFNYIEKYSRNNGSSNNGLYCYNFCLNSNPYDYQPSGAINLSKFKTIELELVTNIPSLDPEAQFFTVCDANGNVVGVNKTSWNIFNYNYDLTLFEERYNVIIFSSGNCGLMYSR
jgi:hypothetical protein